LQHLQARAVWRQQEGLAPSDDIRIEFDGGQARGRQPVMTELDERAAAEADQDDAFGARVEQQEGHHLPRVAELQRVGRGEAHGALHQTDIEEEMAPLAVVDDEGSRIGLVQQLRAQGAGIRPGRFQQQQPAGGGVEGAGHFEPGECGGHGR
jgi:hypothetical protein